MSKNAFHIYGGRPGLSTNPIMRWFSPYRDLGIGHVELQANLNLAFEPISQNLGQA